MYIVQSTVRAQTIYIFPTWLIPIFRLIKKFKIINYIAEQPFHKQSNKAHIDLL